ncbi:hypothetical protein ACUS6I_02455 [Pseudomonas aeruginosa]|uniref:hypothetical protein n=1 Tax=Pseudomonas aeruginosa TaxID=287 RepID=UPI004053D360
MSGPVRTCRQRITCRRKPPWPALAEEIRRLPISRRLELTQALLHRAGPEVERQWPPVAEDRLADCRAGTADALPLAEMLKRLGR